jgi:fatty acid desaturase
LLEGLNLHVASLRVLVTRPDLPWRRLEAGIVALRLAGYMAAVIVVLSPAKAVTFLAVQLALFGLFLGGAFAPNHKGMPIVPRDLRVDFLRRQVLMSRNIRGGAIVNILMGGLNYQIEHHLFPSMPRASLSRARPIVQSFCREKDVKYTETSLVSSYATVVRYLNAVGMGQSDPFTCPMVQQFRN